MFQALIIKMFARMNLWAGILLRKRRIPYNPTEIKTILVKRTDRIGDAVVSLPLLLELNKHFKITILTSEYNNFFLKSFLKPRFLLKNL